ncbi:hypothetical protein AUC70_08535 [Methyloceanibacter stevinii]|uniref:Uncharacterized protein n=1 Tax=Methyloceanibacter stevinii TaxID=1774970 RepID=A0A1E3VMB8_9HYPH|nr:hypothetical protein AUC70_08535 [Methyloceanibacter stevinii]
MGRGRRWLESRGHGDLQGRCAVLGRLWRRRDLQFGRGGLSNIQIELRRRSARFGLRFRRGRCLRCCWRGGSLGRAVGRHPLRPLVRRLDLHGVVLGFLARAALHELLAVAQGHRQIHVGRAAQRDRLFDFLAGIPVDVELGRRGAAGLALLRVLAGLAAVGGVVDREIEAVAEAHAHGPIAAVGIDAAIDRRLVFLAGAAEEVEDSAARLGGAATAVLLHGALELLLPAPVAAAP